MEPMMTQTCPSKKYLVLWIGPSYETEAMEMDGSEVEKLWLKAERPNIEMIYKITGQVDIDELLNSDGETLGL